MIHAVEKALKDLGDKVTGDERVKTEGALNDLKTVLKSDDKDAIEKKTEALSQASASIAQRAYSANQPGGDAGGGGAAEERARKPQPAVLPVRAAAARSPKRKRTWWMRSSRKCATRAVAPPDRSLHRFKIVMPPSAVRCSAAFAHRIKTQDR